MAWALYEWGIGTGGLARHHTGQEWINSLTHEEIHMWDFRGDMWLQGPDPAHAFTLALEPIFEEWTMRTFMGAGPFPPGFIQSFLALRQPNLCVCCYLIV